MDAFQVTEGVSNHLLKSGNVIARASSFGMHGSDAIIIAVTILSTGYANGCAT